MDREMLIEAAKRSCEHNWMTNYLIPLCSECGFTEDGFRYFNRGVEKGFNAALAYHAKQNAEAEKWIPVSERLPDDIHERCFWTLKRPHNRGYRVVIKSVAETEWSGVEAVAWMPLPAPYLEQAEGGEE